MPLCRLSWKENRSLGKMVPIGRVAEWSIASVLKTEVPQGTVGSNPTSSVIFIPIDQFCGRIWIVQSAQHVMSHPKNGKA